MSNTNHSLTRGSIAAKAAALLTAAALGLTGFALTGGNAASAAETTPTAATAAQSQEDTPFDYYAGIPNLPSDHVFENITLERLEDILRYGKGNFVILIGGTWDSATTAALPAINTAAKAQGIEKIYNFDPHLDNAGADTLVNINDKNNAVDAFAKRFQQTIDEFGLTDLQSKNTANVVDLPTLFTYNKDNTGDKVLASTANVADSAELTRVLGTAKNAATRTNGQFYTNYYLNNVSAGAASVFKQGEDKDFSLISVTYGELEKLLQSPGNHYIFFGATWCGNTYATIRYVNQEARKYGIKHVYTFDTILDNTSGKGSPFHIRDNYNNGSHPLSDLYMHLVNTYLPNLVTEDGSHGVVDSKGVGATRLQVPLLLHYNKNNAAQLPGTDQPAGPVTDEVVDYHGKTANVDAKPQPTAREYMLNWYGTTYDDKAIIQGGFSITGDDLSAAKNYGRKVNNDRDAYIAQADHFYSLLNLRGEIAQAKTVSLDGYSADRVAAFKKTLAAAEKTVSDKKATISATDTATKNIANAVTALAGGNNGGSGNGNGSGSGDTGNNPVAGNTDNAGGNDSTAGNKPSRKIVVAGNEPLSRTGAEATVIASVALSLALTAAGALALSRNRGDAAAAQALSDSTRPTSAR